jgi:hypothetical protein
MDRQVYGLAPGLRLRGSAGGRRSLLAAERHARIMQRGACSLVQYFPCTIQAQPSKTRGGILWRAGIMERDGPYIVEARLENVHSVSLSFCQNPICLFTSKNLLSLLEKIQETTYLQN